MLNYRQKTKTNSLIVLVSSLGIIILLNFISIKKFFRLDFTKEKIYTLSKASKKVMSTLDDPLIIKVYFSKNLPPPYNNNARFLKDQLDEFKAYSKGNLKVDFIDPGEDEELEKELMMIGIPPIQLTNIKNDKFEIKKGFMGLAILFEDKKEIIPLIKSTIGLEYDIIRKIKKVISKNLKKIAFLTGHGEPDINKEMGTVINLIREQYHVTTINIKDADIPNDVDTIIIVGPKENITELEKYRIDQFIMKGKTVAFLLDSQEVDLKTFTTKPVNSNLNDLLEHYGAKINNDLVLDLNNKRIQIQQRRGFITMTNIVNYPLIPIFRDMNKDINIASNLEGVFLPFSSSIELKKDTDANLSVKSMIKSSEKSWRQTDTFTTNPMEKFKINTSKKGPFTVAAVILGKFKSFYTGKNIPKNDTEKVEEKNITLADEKNKTIEISPNSRIVVVGDSDFIKDEMLMDNTNLPFIINIVDWLAQDEDLISIRSRGVTDRPLKEISDFKKKLIKSVDIFGMSLIVIIFGLVRWKIRQIKKKSTLVL